MSIFNCTSTCNAEWTVADYWSTVVLLFSAQSTVKMLPFWRMYFGELCIGAALSLYILNYLFGRTRTRATRLTSGNSTRGH